MLTSPDLEKFMERGLDPELAMNLGARFRGGRFEFDYMKASELYNRKFRTADKKFWFEQSGKPLQFWGLDEVPLFPSRPAEPLAITEGEFDRIAVLQGAGGYALSVPNGGSVKKTEETLTVAEDTGFVYLWQDGKVIPQVDQFARIILCTDDDPVGVTLRDELALRLGPSRCWFVTYPPGCKDANEVLLKHGADGVRALIIGAKPMRPGHLVSLMDAPPRKSTITYSSGWKCLDRHFMIERPEIIVVTGVPGHGKGQFTRCLAFNLARAHGWRTAFLAQEDPAHRIKRDALRYASQEYLKMYSGMPQWDMSRGQTDATEQWVREHFFVSMMPEDEEVTLEMVEDEMTAAVLSHDCQMFVLDPWNEIEHKRLKGEIENEYIERSLRHLHRKCRFLNLVLVIVAHPTKLLDGKKPELYNICGASNWKNKAQHGIIIHRESEYSNLSSVRIEKSKDWETMGVPGEVTMDFNRERCNFFSLTE